MDVAPIDFETDPFAPGNMAPRPVCLAQWDFEEDEATLSHWSEAEEPLREVLEGNRPVAIASAAYDMAVTMAHMPRLIPQVFDAYDRGIIKDVLIQQKLIDLAWGKHGHFGVYSLESAVWRLFKKRLNKDDGVREDFARLHGLPIDEWPERHILYALDDTYWHKECYVAQIEELEKEDCLDILDNHTAQAQADLALNLASTWGITTDPEGVERLRKMSVERMEDLRPALIDEGLLLPKRGGGYTKKKAPAQERIFVSMGGKGDVVWTEKGKRKIKKIRTFVPDPEKSWRGIPITKTGKERRKADEDWKLLKYISTSAEACEDSGDQLMIDYAEYSRLDGLLGGQLKSLSYGTVAPLHTRFEVLLETGRTSSSGGMAAGFDEKGEPNKAGNIQNVRRLPGVRECFKPREGTVFIGCDFDKAELHTLGQGCINIFGESRLADALNDGVDPHTLLGARLSGLTYEELTDALKRGDEAVAGRELRGKWSSWRDIAKPGNFGFPGGMGPRGMVGYAKSNYGVVIELKDSEDLYHGWQEQWPIVQEYLEWIRSQLDAEGFMNVRHFLSNRWRSKVPYTVGANSYFQGMAADGAKRALYEVARRQYNDRRSALYGTRTVNFVHDELILEAPLEQASDAAWELRDVMVEEFNFFTPDVPVRATPCLMDRWSKKAKTLIDEQGRLQVWKYRPQ